MCPTTRTAFRLLEISKPSEVADDACSEHHDQVHTPATNGSAGTTCPQRPSRRVSPAPRRKGRHRDCEVGGAKLGIKTRLPGRVGTVTSFPSGLQPAQ